jgi:hypothetical protein
VSVALVNLDHFKRINETTLVPVLMPNTDRLKRLIDHRRTDSGNDSNATPSGCQLRLPHGMTITTGSVAGSTASLYQPWLARDPDTSNRRGATDAEYTAELPVLATETATMAVPEDPAPIRSGRYPIGLEKPDPAADPSIRYRIGTVPVSKFGSGRWHGAWPCAETPI